MIVRKIPVADLGACIGYHFKPAKSPYADCIFSNLGNNDPFWMQREFDAIAAMAPRATNRVAHVVLAVHPADAHLVDRKCFQQIALDFRTALGYGATQAAAWLHSDTDHPHIHLLCNRVSPSGKVVNQWRDMKAMSEFRKSMCERYGFRKASRKRFDEVHLAVEASGKETYF